jgi:hypothetical protein
MQNPGFQQQRGSALTKSDLQQIATLTPEKLEQLRMTVQEMAATDTAFRDALLTDARVAITEVIQRDFDSRYQIPKALLVAAIDDTNRTCYLVIPSSDKAACARTELEKLSLDLAVDPEFRKALHFSPSTALKEFKCERGGRISQVLNDSREPQIIFEDIDEFLIWVPPKPPTR